MERLYKRIVTMSMISLTSLLAWVYCVLEYRGNAVYVIGASVVLVLSLYALLFTFIDLRMEKDSKLQTYISQTIAENIVKLQQSDNSEDAIRLLKAMYIQLRKRNASDTDKVVAATINKAMRAIIKYNQSNNNVLVSNISNLSGELEAIKAQIAAIQKTQLEAPKTVYMQPAPMNGYAADGTALRPDANLDAFAPEQPISAGDTASGETVSASAPATDEVTAGMVTADAMSAEPDDTAASENMVNSFFDSFGTPEEAATENESSPADETSPIADVIPFPTENIKATGELPVTELMPTEAPPAEEPDANRQLSPDEIAALFASASAPTDTPSASAPEEKTAPAGEPDTNRQLSQDEIAALFASTTTPDEMAPVEELPSVTDLTPIEEPDTNRQLSQDEIAALFASASDDTPIETTPVDIPDSDPNRQLSPDEIAALFASTSAETPAADVTPITELMPTEEPPAEDSDPNKMLSPDEIAAMFAAMNS